MSTSGLDHLHQQLEDLASRGLRRQPIPAPEPGTVSFASNDYLGLAALPTSVAPRGSGASRLITGDHDAHRAVERAFAEWLGLEDALLFTSGYAANVGMLSALLGPDDLVVSDALNHASIIDGIRLARCRPMIVPHADVAAVRRALAAPRRGRAWVVVESYYSMDADGYDAAELAAACREAGALLVVDEAHALGVLGPGGRGLFAARELRPDVVVGTLGKAFGAQGAFVAGPRVLREWLWNRARSFVFSTGIAPASAASALDSLDRLKADPSLPERVLASARRLRDGLGHVAPSALRGFGHIVPFVVGAAERTVALAADIRADGVHVVAIRPPTVPDGTSRLRMTVTAAHSNDDIDRAVRAFERAYARPGR